MYREIFTFLFLFASLNIAQTVNVINTEKLISGDVERLYFPRFSPDGTTIALTKSNYRGLWIYNIPEKKLSKINDHQGSGLDPKITADGIIYFIVDEIKNKTRSRSYWHYDSADESEYKDSIEYKEETWAESSESEIIIHDKGKIKKIKPLGERKYLWPSLSPGKDKILFTIPGEGTFVSDLDARIIAEIGYANAPKWSPDGKWIVYMEDRDDGLNYTSSDIFIASADGKLKYNVTYTLNEIEMYPEWSPDGKNIVYHNLNGDVFITRVDIK